MDAGGAPFPTVYWLTCPDAVKAVSRVESSGAIASLNERAESDAAFGEALEAAHRAYANERDGMLADDEPRAAGGVAGTRAGIKCLHAHYAYYLAGGQDPVGSWTAGKVEPIHPQAPGGRGAAIDQGTNSIRLLVAEPLEGNEIGELARDMVITRLGRGVDATGRLETHALERTVAVLARYGRRARALGAERIRVAATSAVRDASNRQEYEAAVREHAGSELEVLSGEREAELSFLGATHGLDAVDAPGPYWVFDIGGGSTEFVVGGRRPERAISTRMGSVRLTERHVRSDRPEPGEMAAMATEVEAVLDEVETAVPVREARTLVAVAGTATTLKAMSLGLDRYDPEAIHRTWLTADEVERSLEQLAAMTNAERAALPFMAPGRGDVIVAGALVLRAAMRRFDADRALVSETDILDGLGLELLGVV